MTTNTEQLLPCPFCGGRSEFNEHDDECYFTALAKSKAAPKGDVSWAVDLIPAWNRRAALTQPAQAAEGGEAVAWLCNWPGQGKETWHHVYINESDAIDRKRNSGGEIVPLYTAPPASQEQAPIPMVLHCPKCGMQHIDSADPMSETEGWLGAWTNPPHRSHLCHGCGTIWRPADVPTTGVAAVSTKGQADTWAPGQEQAQQPDICPGCHGSGEGSALSGGGPEAYDVLGPCQTCGGSGEQAQQPSMAPSIHEDNYRVVAGVLTDLRNILGLADGDSLIDAVMALKQQPSGGGVVGQIVRFMNDIEAVVEFRPHQGSPLKVGDALTPATKPEPMTDEQAYDLFGVHYQMGIIRAVEAHHGIKRND